jgi:hypothetical protein
MHKHEIPANIPIDRETHINPQNLAEAYLKIIEKYPKVSTYIEVDYYQQAENISLEESRSFKLKSRERVDKIVNDLSNYFFSTKVKE